MEKGGKQAQQLRMDCCMKLFSIRLHMNQIIIDVNKTFS